MTPPTARTYALLAAVAAAFVVYGSFVPFNYQPRPWAEAVGAWQWVIENRTHVASRSDWAANVLLGVPVGFCLLAALRVDRPGVNKSLLAAAAVWPAGVLLSAGVEFGQLYFPGRTSSLTDVMAQSLGVLAGVLAWVALGQRATNFVRGVWDGPRVGGPAGRLLVLYVAALGLVQLLPLDVQTSPADWYRKVRDGGVTFVPFTEMAAPGAAAKWPTWLELAGLYLPVGLLAAGRVGRSWEMVGRVAAAGFLLALVLEAAQIVVQSRHPSVTDALIGGLAVLVGWGVGRSLADGYAFDGLPLETALILGQGWLFVLAVVNWVPFDFDGAVGPDRLRALNWLPFAQAQQQHPLMSLEQAAVKLMLYAPFGALAAALGTAGRSRAPVAAAIAAAIAAVLEGGQLFLPSRVPGPTDILYAAAGGWFGAVATAAVRRAVPTFPPPLSHDPPTYPGPPPPLPELGDEAPIHVRLTHTDIDLSD